MDQKLIDRFVERAHDVVIYEMLLKRWLEVYDTIEEWILNGLVKEDIDDLYRLTKEQLKYHKNKFTGGTRVKVGTIGTATIIEPAENNYYLIRYDHNLQFELIHESDLEEIKSE